MLKTSFPLIQLSINPTIHQSSNPKIHWFGISYFDGGQNGTSAWLEPRRLDFYNRCLGIDNRRSGILLQARAEDA
jgi:hypothetical protein